MCCIFTFIQNAVCSPFHLRAWFLGQRLWHPQLSGRPRPCGPRSAALSSSPCFPRGSLPAAGGLCRPPVTLISRISSHRFVDSQLVCFCPEQDWAGGQHACGDLWLRGEGWLGAVSLWVLRGAPRLRIVSAGGSGWGAPGGGQEDDPLPWGLKGS